MPAPLVLPQDRLHELVQLLRALHLYRLLDHDTMRRVGVAQSREIVAQLATFAWRKKLVGRTEAPLVAGVRRLPHLYWLTHKGAATLNRHDDLTGEDEAIGAARRFKDMNEVMHRIGLVELHVSARAWCHAAGIELDGFTVDFEPGSKGRQKKTAFTGPNWGYAPDAVAWVSLPGEEAQRLLVIELERGGEAGDLYPFFSEKLPHMKAVAAGEYVENSLDLPDLARFLIVFGSHAKYKDGTPKLLHELALEKWPDKADPVWDRFFIKSQDEAAAGFGTPWRQVGDRQPRALFQVG